MLLIDESGNLLSHLEVDQLQKTKEGLDTFSRLLMKNRSYDAAMAVKAFLVRGGIVPGLNDIQDGILFKTIYHCMTATEEEQNDFAFENANPVGGGE